VGKKTSFDLAAYQAVADGWEADRYDSMRKQRNLMLGVSLAALLAAAGAGVGVAALAPLKTSEPYLLVHNTATGEVKELTRLRANPDGVRSITEDDAVVSSFLVPYIIARETYDKRDFKTRAETVQIFSDARAYAAYDALHRSENAAENPFRRYGNDKVEVSVTRVAFLNTTTAQVGFSTKWIRQVGTVEGRSVATVSFAFTSTPSELGIRWRNPLGFKVTSYRVDQEILSNG
jgi:type IV secretion system protein VirB8